MKGHRQDRKSQGGLKALILALAVAIFPFAAQAGEAVNYVVQGETFEGYRAKANGDSKGLVLIIHDWDGLTEYEMKRADMLADMGYDAFAVDLFGKGNRPIELHDKKNETGRLYQDRERMRSLIVGGLQEARKASDQKAVVMGYCFGGAATLELARSGEVKNIAGYASFHGGLETPEGQTYRSDTPPILIAHGGADTSVRWMTWRTFHASWRAQACLTESRSIRGAAWLHRARLRPLPRAR